VEKQAAILHDAARFLRKGGRLIYATCSLLRPENEDQVDRFLAEHGDFALVDDMPQIGGAAAPGEGGMVRLTPARHGTDGFFAAVLERR
jgi:16S rRNA (cytosine967-C5)-methyltransferase